MKRLHFFYKTVVSAIVILGISNNPSQACDACGCFTGLNAAGILPQFQKNFIGYRFLSTRFNHPVRQSSYSHQGQVSRDEIYVQQVWARWYPHERMPVFVNLPYRQHIRVAEKGNETLQGVGDFSIKSYYQLLRPNDTLVRKWKHVLMIGGGIDLPTGKYQQRDGSGKLYPMGFQLGSGAFTYELRAIYTIRYKAVGLNNEIYTLLPQSNELEYMRGKVKGFSSSVFWWFQRPKFVLMPFIGLGRDMVSKDSEYGMPLSSTGGDFIRYSAGLDVYWKSWVLTFATDQIAILKIASSAPTPGSSLRLTALKSF